MQSISQHMVDQFSFFFAGATGLMSIAKHCLASILETAAYVKMIFDW